MAALDFTDITAAGTLVAELTGLAAPSDVDNLLGESAGTHTSETVTVYRPYLVAALILKRALNTRRLKEARGAVFDNPVVTIRGLMQQQASFDEKMSDAYSDWEIPAGFETSGSSTARVVF